MKKRRRIVFVGLVALLLGVAAWFALRPREPEYQGKTLSYWLEELTALQNWKQLDDSSSEELHKRRSRAETALREMGTNAISHLLALIRDGPKESRFRNKIEDLLDRQSLLDWRPAERSDRSWQAVEGFVALGPSAQPAIPGLVHLLKSDGTGVRASLCLVAIGPSAVPALTGVLSNSNPRVQQLALETLGDLGLDAREITPLLTAITSQAANPMAGTAMRVLSEVSENPEQFVPLFAQYIRDSKLAPDALFALTRVWPHGIPFLLQALTNADEQIKKAPSRHCSPKSEITAEAEPQVRPTIGSETLAASLT